MLTNSVIKVFYSLSHINLPRRACDLIDNTFTTHTFLNLLIFNLVLLQSCVFWHLPSLLYLTENFFARLVVQEGGILFLVFVGFTLEFVQTSHTFGFPFIYQLFIHPFYNFFCIDNV